MYTHTPGPWEYREIPHSKGIGHFNYSITYALSRVAQVIAEEDAALIAAAPDLLAALEDIVNDAPILAEGKGVLGQNALAAIAKARGRTASDAL